MARKKSMNIANPPCDPWQAQSDAGDIMRVSTLRQDKPRFAKAMSLIKGAAALEGGKQPRMKARSGRRTKSRNLGR